MPRPVRVLLALLTAAVAVWTVSLLPGVRTPGQAVPLLDVGLRNALWPLFVVVAVWRVLAVRADRLAWSFLAASVTVGSTLSFAFYAVLPFAPSAVLASVVDVGWLALYPLAYAGFVLLLGSDGGRRHRAVWLDALLAAFAGGSVAALALIGRLLTLDSHELLPALVHLAYPLGDLLLLMVVASVFGALGWRAGRAWTFLGLGFAVQSVSDAGYAAVAGGDSWQVGTLLDSGWTTSMLLVVLAAWQRPRRAAARAGGQGHLVGPAVSAVLCVAVLFTATVVDVPLVVSLLALGGVLTSIARTVVAFRQARDLAVFRSQARTDELTGLANRRRFTEALSAALRRPAPGRAGVLLVDLDRFKEVNDSLGHAAGDELLLEVGRRFATALRPGDVLARFGGDEFAVLTRERGDATAAGLAARLSAALAGPFVLSGVRVHVGASTGVAVSVDGSEGAAELIRRADVAMYRAKAERCAVHQYADAFDEQSRDRLRLVDELRTGIEDGQLVLHHQPKIAIASGRVTGVEALVRWQHPERGLVPPDQFLPLVEDAGLSSALSAQVLRMALRDCARWHAEGLEISVAVNLSTSELLDEDLPCRVAALLREVGLTGSALVVEITESVFMVDKRTSVAVLSALRAQGIRISIDDYGTGYSSLAYLRELPLDELKLDRSFTQDLDTDPRTAAIVASTVALAHSLGLSMVAEGVESDAVLERLRSGGCDLAQGYHVSRPLPADALGAWFAQLDPQRSWRSGPRAGRVADSPA